MNTPHRYDYSIAGNCSYLAYINRNSSLDWLCWPRFDSPSVFGKLISGEEGGKFAVIPEGKHEVSQSYQENSNIVVTTMRAADWEIEVIDFAPRFRIQDRLHKPLQFFRKIRRVRGCPKVRVICRPAGTYGLEKASVLEGSNHLQYTNLHVPLRLTTNASKTYIGGEIPFVVNEDLYFILSCGEAFEGPLTKTFEEFYHLTLKYWQEWVKSTFIPSIFQTETIRSSLILKLHQYEDTGAVIAAGTTSLPEHPGSGRNWDYRYCWIRDTHFILASLNSLGHFDEAVRYSQYVLSLATNETIAPVFRIDGSSDLREYIIDVEGYRGEGPVRIGNQAQEQIQNDVYGQVILSLSPLFTDRRLLVDRIHPPLSLIHHLLNQIERTLPHADAGIWEFRGIQRQHVATTVFHWAGAVAAMKIAKLHDDQALFQKADELRAAAGDVIERCWRENPGVYTAHTGGEELDAAAFLLVTMGYLSPTDPRTKSHVMRLKDGLMGSDGYIRRYVAPDDFGETHSSFLICHFWYAESLAVLGMLEESQKEIQKIISTANHVGLMSEDIDSSGGQWGNFPQTYSHVGLINAVTRLARKIDKPSWF